MNTHANTHTHTHTHTPTHTYRHTHIQMTMNEPLYLMNMCVFMCVCVCVCACVCVRVRAAAPPDYSDLAVSEEHRQGCLQGSDRSQPQEEPHGSLLAYITEFRYLPPPLYSEVNACACVYACGRRCVCVCVCVCVWDWVVCASFPACLCQPTFKHEKDLGGYPGAPQLLGMVTN